jgi:DUF4097 and DUF4098 domain-containing protein YvlB
MRRIALLTLLSSLLLSPLARADEWSRTYNIVSKPELRVTTSDGNIHVDTWDKNTIDARITTSGWKIGEGGIKIYEHQAGDAIELEVRFPHGITFAFHNRKVDIDIHMPREGRVALRTGDGNIRMASFKGNVDIESGDGAEELDALDGYLRAHSGDGNIRAAGRFDAMDISTGDGRIDARAADGSSLASSWSLRSGDGNVTLELPNNLAADVDLKTGDGRIIVDVPLTMEGRLNSNNIRGKLNGGGNLLSIHTGDGSIRLQKL